LGGINQEAGFLLRENASGSAEGGGDGHSPGHGCHASRGVHKRGESWLGYDAWEH
jgi:hypothetical protein